jgi:hypothetical protein
MYNTYIKHQYNNRETSQTLIQLIHGSGQNLRLLLVDWMLGLFVVDRGPAASSLDVRLGGRSVDDTVTGDGIFEMRALGLLAHRRPKGEKDGNDSGGDAHDRPECCLAL